MKQINFANQYEKEINEEFFSLLNQNEIGFLSIKNTFSSEIGINVNESKH